MHLQELFDTAVAHARKQGERCVMPGEDQDDLYSDCAYRGENGRACLVGGIIVDDAYDPRLEGQAVSDPEVRIALEKSIGRSIEAPDTDLLVRMQGIHDNYLPSRWEEEFQEVAHRCGLTYTPPQTA